MAVTNIPQMMQDFDRHAFAQQLGPTTVELSVSEMIELAKAGVAIELAGKVQIDRRVYPPTFPEPNHGRDISEGIRNRYVQSQQAKLSEHDRIYGLRASDAIPELCAFAHAGKVYVFAYSGNSPPEVIEDDAAIYPSDALLARIHLMMQHGK